VVRAAAQRARRQRDEAGGDVGLRRSVERRGGEGGTVHQQLDGVAHAGVAHGNLEVRGVILRQVVAGGAARPRRVGRGRQVRRRQRRNRGVDRHRQRGRGRAVSGGIAQLRGNVVRAAAQRARRQRDEAGGDVGLRQRLGDRRRERGPVHHHLFCFAHAAAPEVNLLSRRVALPIFVAGGAARPRRVGRGRQVRRR